MSQHTQIAEGASRARITELEDSNRYLHNKLSRLSVDMDAQRRQTDEGE